jgi:N-terminal acetyltransferase B complex non-catalytic subunit
VANIQPSQDQSDEELLDAACAARPISRASYIAKLQYLKTKDDDKSLDAIVKACEEYADAFSTKAFCFDDLKNPLFQLDKKRLQAFRDARAAADQTTLEQLFTLELEYSLLPNEGVTKDLVDFAVRALKLYYASLSETSPPPCPEGALLSVLAILRLGTTVVKNRQQQQIDYDHILRAVILLETVRSAFEDYYSLTVVLIRLQRYLGQLSSAMATFTKLSIKNMQYETVAHLILTRISSLHPAAITSTTSSSSSSGDEAFDPLSAIETGLTVLENADSALVRGVREGLRFNSYSNIHNSVDMRQQLQNSASRRIYAVEERKLRRLRGLSDDNTVLDSDHPVSGGSKADQDGDDKYTPLADSRDFTYFPNFRDDDSELFQTRFSCGPLPHGPWVRAMALLDHVATFLKAELMGQQAGVGAKAFESIKVLVGRSESSKERDGGSGEARRTQKNEDLTDAELWNLECHGLLAKAALLIGDATASVPQDQVGDLLSQLKAWVQKTLEDQKNTTAALEEGHFPTKVAGIPIYTWEGLHTSITRLETLQAVALLLGLLGKKAKMAKGKTIPKDALAEIQTLVVELEKEIHDAARKVKEGINAPGVLGKLVDLGFARDGDGDGQGEGENSEVATLGDILEKASDEVKMETICGKIKDSWEDALDGVLAVKVKLWK